MTGSKAVVSGLAGTPNGIRTRAATLKERSGPPLESAQVAFVQVSGGVAAAETAYVRSYRSNGLHAGLHAGGLCRCDVGCRERQCQSVNGGRNWPSPLPIDAVATR